MRDRGWTFRPVGCPAGAACGGSVPESLSSCLIGDARSEKGLSHLAALPQAPAPCLGEPNEHHHYLSTHEGRCPVWGDSVVFVVGNKLHYPGQGSLQLQPLPVSGLCIHAVGIPRNPGYGKGGAGAGLNPRQGIDQTPSRGSTTKSLLWVGPPYIWSALGGNWLATDGTGPVGSCFGTLVRSAGHGLLSRYANGSKSPFIIPLA